MEVPPFVWLVVWARPRPSEHLQASLAGGAEASQYGIRKSPHVQDVAKERGKPSASAVTAKQSGRPTKTNDSSGCDHKTRGR